MEPRAPLPASADAEAITPDARAPLLRAAPADRTVDEIVPNGAEIADIDGASAPNELGMGGPPAWPEPAVAQSDPGEAPGNLVSSRPAPRWLWPLLLTLTALGSMVVGWYASSFASQRHLLP